MLNLKLRLYKLTHKTLGVKHIFTEDLKITFCAFTLEVVAYLIDQILNKKANNKGILGKQKSLVCLNP